MATANSEIVGIFSSLSCSFLSPLHRKGMQGSFSSITEGCWTAAARRLSRSVVKRTMRKFVLFSSNYDQQPDEAGGAELSGEAFLPPGDVDYLWKLAAGSVGGGAAIKYGSILFPDITRPNLVQALLMISLSMLVAAIVLIKESYSNTNEDRF